MIQAGQDVSIANSFSPFGNHSDFSRFGDDGSAMIEDVNGVLMWQDPAGVVRLINNSELAAPLLVSGTEAIVWQNALVTTLPRGPLQVGIYRVDAGTGTVGVPTAVTMAGTIVLPTSLVTTTSNSYTLVTAEDVHCLLYTCTSPRD